jgi:hypothetical protein
VQAKVVALIVFTAIVGMFLHDARVAALNALLAGTIGIARPPRPQLPLITCSINARMQ